MKQNANRNYTLYSSKLLDGQEVTTAHDLFSENDDKAIDEALKIIEKRNLDKSKCSIEFYEKIDSKHGVTKTIDL